MAETVSKLQQLISELRLSVAATFIPWSQSRNRDEDYPSLNWKITLLKDGQPVLTTDYMAGCGQCPSYVFNLTQRQQDLVRRECEVGKAGGQLHGKAILPLATDVIDCLVSDAEALDYRDFEEWAHELGFNPDSRKAEAIYNACLNIGLALRKALGDANLCRLLEAAQDE